MTYFHVVCIKGMKIGVLEMTDTSSIKQQKIPITEKCQRVFQATHYYQRDSGAVEVDMR